MRRPGSRRNTHLRVSRTTHLHARRTSHRHDAAGSPREDLRGAVWSGDRRGRPRRGVVRSSSSCRLVVPSPISFHAASRNEGRRVLAMRADVCIERRTFLASKKGRALTTYIICPTLVPSAAPWGRWEVSAGRRGTSSIAATITGPFRASWRGWSRRAVVRRARSRCRSRGGNTIRLFMMQACRTRSLGFTGGSFPGTMDDSVGFRVAPVRATGR